MNKTAIVIVTYKRQELLERLFASILHLDSAPWAVVVVDNENSATTGACVDTFASAARSQWPELLVRYEPQLENSGGAGGFSAGVRVAFDLGAQWFWLMDDDVAVMPDALDILEKWAEKSDVIQGQRRDFDGGLFYWQYKFMRRMCMYNPLGKASFEGKASLPADVMCFEGAYFSRRVVETIGLPDPRFFIYFDDACYGYVASKMCQPLYVADVVLQRTREIANKEIGSARQLNSTSDMTRFHIMRNRAYIARYQQIYGDYNPVGYAFGTLAVLGKEILRLMLVDRGHFAASWKRLKEGWKASRCILHDASWQPMPPYHGNANS